MARWLAIVSLLLGLGLTAFTSFQEPERRRQPVTQSAVDDNVGVTALEGSSGIPTPRP